MKSILTVAISILLFINTTHAQLDDIYEDRRWDFFTEFSTYTSTVNNTSSNTYMIKPIYLRFVSEKSEQWKSHFSWQISLGSDAIWGVAGLALPTGSSLNSLDDFNSFGISSGILGNFNWTINILGGNKLNIAIGPNFGDYASGGGNTEGYHFGAGPSALIEYALFDNISIGVNYSYSKIVASTSDDAKGNLVIQGLYPRILFESGWYVEPGMMFTNNVVSDSGPGIIHTSGNSRFDLKIGKAISW